MKESKNEQNRKIKIIQGKGNEWSEALYRAVLY